jgi:hypothetical protein
MAGWYSRSIVPWVLAVGLLCWPMAAWAQGCYITSHGDYICDRDYQAPARSAPKPPAQPYKPIYNEKRDAAIRYREEMERLRQEEIRKAQQALKEAQARERERPATGGPPFTPPPCSASVPGTSYFAAPNGTGTACTASSPCSLATAIRNAGPGDEVVLKDGVYNYDGGATVRDGAPGRPIVIRAENPQGATIARPKGNKWDVLFRVRHSYITVRGIVFDGDRRSCPSSLRLIWQHENRG